MSLKEMSTWTWREHFLAYALATACDLILLVPQSQLSARAGQQLDIVLPIVLHQSLIGVLVVLLSLSGGLKTWRWQYKAVGILFASYVGFRIATRFVAGLELINSIASQGADVTGMLPMLYFYGLGAAAVYTGMILTMRRAYGKLASTRSWPQNLQQD